MQGWEGFSAFVSRSAWSSGVRSVVNNYLITGLMALLIIPHERMYNMMCYARLFIWRKYRAKELIDIRIFNGNGQWFKYVPHSSVERGR